MMDLNSNILPLHTLPYTRSHVGVDTVSHTQSSSTSGWSKEAIFTLLSVFLTIVLAIVGFTLRYYLNKGSLGFPRRKRCRSVGAGELHVEPYMHDTC